MSHSRRRLSTEDFIRKALEVHGDKYNYSLVNYVNAKTKVKIICPVHGEFEQFPYAHVGTEQGCSACSNNRRITTKSIKERFEKKFGDNLVDFSKVENVKNNSQPLRLICKICGKEFFKPYNKLIQRGGHYCNYNSKGEKLIEKILKENGIKFIQQFKFPDCTNNQKGKSKRFLPFDFYIYKYNTCIEFQGIQHFEPVEKFGGFEDFLVRIKNDQIKKNYCKTNEVNLLYINFYQTDNIEEILKEKKII